MKADSLWYVCQLTRRLTLQINTLLVQVTHMLFADSSRSFLIKLLVFADSPSGRGERAVHWASHLQGTLLYLSYARVTKTKGGPRHEDGEGRSKQDTNNANVYRLRRI